MLKTLKSLLGIGPGADYRELVKNGAQIIDVRTPGEFQSGHIKGSKNIPLQNLQNGMKKIDKSKPVITCCASGVRSGSAKRMLQSNGFVEVYNGGGWMSLRNKI
ncbi:MAG: rhodanese-like domain-containing protein [Flavobacteriales bacterium]|nr:rhodanese-like domain-containing protein [Flavobacteriales bacterium]